MSTKPAATTDLPKPKPMLAQGDLGNAEFDLKHNVIFTPHDLKDVCDPYFWRSTAQMLEPGQIITVIQSDYEYFALLMVLDTGINEAHVHPVLHSSTLEEGVTAADRTVPDGDSPYFAQLCGKKRFCVRRRQDGKIVREGLQTKVAALKEAAAYNADHAKTRADLDAA